MLRPALGRTRADLGNLAVECLLEMQGDFLFSTLGITITDALA